jgi:hypothetical protein
MNAIFHYYVRLFTIYSDPLEKANLSSYSAANSLQGKNGLRSFKWTAYMKDETETSIPTNQKLFYKLLLER